MKFKKILLLLLIITLCASINYAEEKIISGTVETTTHNGTINIKINMEGSESQQEMTCMEDQTSTYPIQIKKDLTCTTGTVEKCDEKFSNLTQFMQVFGNAFNHTVSEEFAYCIQTRATNTALAIKLDNVNETFELCDDRKKLLEANLSTAQYEYKNCLKSLSGCESKPRDCSQDIQTVNEENKKNNTWYILIAFAVGCLATYAFFLRKTNAKTPGGNLPGR